MADDWDDTWDNTNAHTYAPPRQQQDIQKKCNNCGGIGHVARVCSSPSMNSGGNNPKNYHSMNNHRHQQSQNGHGGGGVPQHQFHGNSYGDRSRNGGGGNNSYGGRGNQRDQRTCHKCNRPGHIARECTNDTDVWGEGAGLQQPNRDSWSNKYRNSEDSSGQHHRDPWKNNQHSRNRGDQNNSWDSKRGGGFNNKSGNNSDGRCFKCEDVGHIAKNCPTVLNNHTSSTNGQQQAASKKEEYIPPEITEDTLYEDDYMYSTGINFENYENIPCEVTGQDPPPPIETFEDINLSQLLMSNVKRAKFKNLTPVQKYAVPIILKGRDLMACAQTGSGKTVAFLLPIIQKMILDNVQSHICSPQIPEVLILTPTRELALQIMKESKKFCMKTPFDTQTLYGGTSVTHQFRQFTSKNVNIVAATPGRFLQALREQVVSLKNLTYFVLDEADRMLDMGFGPDIDEVVKDPSMPPKFRRHTLLFSATFPDKIQEAASTYLKEDYLFLKVGTVGSACKDVRQTIYEVKKFEKREKLMTLLQESQEDQSGKTEKTLVFVETKQNADFLALYLSSEFKATSIHGDRFQSQREEALKNFMKGQMTVLVATAVAARGLDIPKVAHVINYDLPGTIDEYVHRIGRTGRVGNVGKATSFFDPDNDQNLSKALVTILEGADQEVPDWLAKEAEKAPGGSGATKGFGGSFGNFGGSDIRKNEMKTVHHAALEESDDDDWD